MDATVISVSTQLVVITKTKVPVSEIRADQQQLIRNLLVLLLVLLAGFVYLAIRLSARITEPLEKLIAELEASPRGAYGGARGYFSLTGDIDFAIVIRTMVLEGRTLTMRAESSWPGMRG